MKTIKQILETTYLPKSGDEKKFWDKHVRKLLDHPVAEPTQFKASTKKSTTNAANRDEASSESVYEAAFNDTAVHTKRADKEPVISRGIDPKTRKGINVVKKAATGEIKIGEEVELEEGIDRMSDARLKFHALKKFPHGSYTRKEIQDEHNRRARVVPNYHTVKPSLNEEADLDEKVTNPYAVGMAAAMKQAGDTPPLKKSTIVKGHDIAKSIKKEAMDPVGKADADIDNDGDTDKSDKYLHNRRKAIGKALKTEGAKESSEANHKKYVAGAKNKEEFKEESEQIDELSKKTLGSYVAKASSAAASDAAKYGQQGSSEKGLDHFRKAYSRLQNIKKAAGKLAKEEVEQIDELSPKTLHSYIKKAAPDIVGRTMSAVASNQSAETKKHASKLGKRISGITSASGRLSDKANAYQYEEVEQIDEIGDTAKGRKALKAVIARAPEKAANSRLRSDVLGRRQFDPDVNSADSERYGHAADKHYKKYQLAVKGAARAVDRLTKEEVEQIDELSTEKLRDYASAALQDKNKEKADKRWKYAGKAMDKVADSDVKASHARKYNKMESADLDEAFKAGQMRLKDGSSVTVSKDCAESLNSLFTQLSPANKTKMEERLMSSPKGYSEILNFAENING